MNEEIRERGWGRFRPVGWRAAWLRALHRLPAGSAWRRLALWARKPIKRAVGEWVDVEVWGLKLRLRSHGNLSEQRLLFMPQYLDATEREALADALGQGGTFFDIGANIGVYSLWVASACGDRVRVEAFEPDRELCERLAFNLSTNRMSNVRVNALALGDREGEAKFRRGDENRGENRVEIGEGLGDVVPMTTLRGFMQREGIHKIDAMKIDVEGHEVDVLRPFFNEAPRAAWPRLLVSEMVLDQNLELAGLLSSTGYDLVARGRLNGVYRLRD